MILSFATANLYTQPFEQVLEIVAEADFQNIELDMYWTGGRWAMAQHLKDVPVKRVVQMIQQSGLRISSIHDGSGTLESRQSTAGFINPDLDRYLDNMGYAPECLVFHTPHVEGQPEAGWWKWMAEEIVRSLEKYQKNCSFVTVENLPPLEGYFVPLLTPEDLNAFVVENGLNATLDTTHYAQMGTDIIEAARILKGVLKTIHLSDFKAERTHVFIGEGDLNLAGFFKAVDTHSLSAITLECSLTLVEKAHREMSKNELISRLREARIRIENLI